MVMKINRFLVVTAAIIGVVLIASLIINLSGPDSNLIEKQDTIFQVSAFNTFSAGNFDGNTTFEELEKRGDFGIGTLNGLNGEMIALDGIFYQVPISGVPRQIDPSEKTPYATVTFFHATKAFQLSNPADYSQLASDINANLQDPNAIYAIRIHGFFDSIKTRSVPIQAEPYPSLTDAVKNQTIFLLNSTQGTAVGFYFPKNMDGVDFSGVHLHFLADDHLSGGHLLECSFSNATVEIDQINNYYLKIP
jgi:acetolactate decarboxylase